ncbi:MAG: CRISPR-associated endonuclease Cas3'', partial [Candidatus Dormibacteria bacterium]
MSYPPRVQRMPPEPVGVLAHSANQEGIRQGLEEHLRTVAQRAAEFCRGFEGEEAARYAGLWHDIGKWSDAFQAYLAACEADPKGRRRGPDHKGAGAVLAAQHLPEATLLIQGHHGGLKAPAECRAWLAERTSDPEVQSALRRARAAMADLEPANEIQLPEVFAQTALASELFVRMLFSALVDADFLDTEHHFQPRQSSQRVSGLDLAELWRRFEIGHASVSARPNSLVDEVRNQVYEACLAAAEEAPGLFRLAVPTGAGKTLSSMAFALRHALKHGHERVIVAVPFITITEQTADVYRRILGDEAGAHAVVLEHHSAAASSPHDDDAHPQAVWQRLASENWDAPVIVTTTVQLFESLFANRTQRCRKVHRLANSVIMLDEAQVLPAPLLRPILDALRSLCTDFGASVVISTATQPAFEAIPEFAELAAREIVAAPARYFRAL